MNIQKSCFSQVGFNTCVGEIVRSPVSFFRTHLVTHVWHRDKGGEPNPSDLALAPEASTTSGAPGRVLGEGEGQSG